MNVWPLVSRPACDEPAAGSLEQHLDDAGERSFAAQHRGGSLAPIPAVRAATIGRLKSTQTGHDRLGLFNYLVGAGEDRRRDYEFTAQPKLVVKI
jgi:hypothetical protein